jgi:hypothetical protein
VLAALAAGLVGWLDPLRWGYDLPAGFADLVLQPEALAGQAVAAGLVVALLLECLAWLVRAVSARRLTDQTTAGWAYRCRRELFPERRRRLTQGEREREAGAWLARRRAALLGRWRWYFLLCAVPAVGALWSGLRLLAHAPGGNRFWDYFLPLGIGTGEGVAAAVLALAILLLGCRLYGRLRDRILVLEKEQAAPPAEPATSFAGASGLWGEQAAAPAEPAPAPPNHAPPAAPAPPVAAPAAFPSSVPAGPSAAAAEPAPSSSPFEEE